MIWITCPNCGLDVELTLGQGFTICPQCGAEIDNDAEIEQRERYLKEKRK